MGRNQRDEPITQFSYTNWVSDPTIDCNNNSALTTCDGLGTVVDALIRTGALSGTVSA